MAAKLFIGNCGIKAAMDRFLKMESGKFQLPEKNFGKKKKLLGHYFNMK